ncbi:GUN4 domain-containing protein [Tumidithrix helvetica]|uniref:GUN4 domain-containing protein n=1 Tax=Tumidithrix helvetica TaxID=3457545 RepID=UPI003CC61CEF
MKIFLAIAILIALLFAYSEFSPPSLNYLESYLMTQQWEKADSETRNLILKITKRKWFGEWLVYLKIEKDPIENFPCGYLMSIDRLWVNYSREHFGFSIQGRVFQKVFAKTKSGIQDDSYEEFFKELGWDIHKKVFQFNLNAPLGHLPSYEWMTEGITKPKIWRADGISLYTRLQFCQAENKSSTE